MSDRKSRIFASIVIILIVMAISFLFMTRENYVRYSFYDATGCQYIEVTKMENAKGENVLNIYHYTSMVTLNHVIQFQKVVPKESLWHIMMIMIYYLL